MLSEVFRVTDDVSILESVGRYFMAVGAYVLLSSIT